jgi:GNAT superfamily N-acetyltransferase
MRTPFSLQSAGPADLQARNPLWLRPYEQESRSAVFALLQDLPRLYPKSEEWLQRRLSDVARGKARCTLAMASSTPIGVTIETPKGRHRLKLSTIYVHPLFRGKGVGTDLMVAAYRQWQLNEVDEVYVTADRNRAPDLGPLLSRFGFVMAAVEPKRYGPNRDEVVFACRTFAKADFNFATSNFRRRAFYQAQTV